MKFRSPSKMIRDEHTNAIDDAASDVIWRDFEKPGRWAAWGGEY